MTVVDWYISRRVVFNLLAILLGLALMSLAFELMEESDNILQKGGGEPQAIARYALLRLPDVFAEMMPIAALLAALVTVILFLRHAEMIGFWNGGISPLRILRGLAPLAVLLTGLQFALTDRAVPAVIAELTRWGVGEFRRGGLVGQDTDAAWMISGSDVVRIPIASARIGSLDGLSIYRRDDQGLLTETWEAATAEPGEGGWLLRDVRRFGFEPPVQSRSAGEFWSGAIDLKSIRLISAQLRELSLADMMVLIENQGFGQRPNHVAATWAHYRVASSLSPVLLIAFVFVLGHWVPSRNAFGPLLLGSLSAAFAYLVFDSAALGLGEAGLLPPFVAGWSAKIVVAALTATILIRQMDETSVSFAAPGARNSRGTT
jgi:lipopolysaccharide export system permease protein